MVIDRSAARLAQRHSTALIGVTVIGILRASMAQANCTTTSPTPPATSPPPSVTCDTNKPNPYATTIGKGPNAANSTSVTLAAGTSATAKGAQVSTGADSAISLADNATITLGAYTVVQNSSPATAGNNGLYSAGSNTIEFRSNGTLTIGVGAIVQALGASNRSEAINLMGYGNTITNYGTILGTGSAAIWFEDKTTSAGNVNTIDNFGLITTALGTNANVIGNNGNSDVNFTNEAGGEIDGSLSFAGGNDALTLYAGSKITGSFNGGGGTNTLTLAGAPSTFDSLSGDIENFQSLVKTGQGTWTLTGAVGANGGNAPLQVQVQQGTLALTGNNANFKGSVTVDPTGTLAVRAESLPPTVTDNGLVQFNQDDDATYSGVISGSGEVEKDLGGSLTLTGANTYAGGTTVDMGTVYISQDSSLGAASGGITLNGGGLGSTANVSTARGITITANGGYFAPQSGTTLTATGVVSGPGDLTMQGPGTLALSATNTYTGDTIINGGTLQVSSDANLGAASSNLQFYNGGALATTADMSTSRTALLGTGGGTLEPSSGTLLTYGGVVSGSGPLTINGGGTVALTQNNTYSGGTTVTGGSTLQLSTTTGLGASSGVLTLDNGTVANSIGINSTRNIVLGAGGGTIQSSTDADDSTQFLTLNGTISGSGGLTKTGPGALILNGSNTYTGATTVSGGYLYVNGDQSGASGALTVGSGTRLGGSGTIGGDVTIASGAMLAPGSQPFTPGTLTVNGSLTLESGSTTFYNMVEPGTAGGALNDLTNVKGNLTLGGTVNILDVGQTLGLGVYRIFNYGGTLTNNGLAVGALTPGPGQAGAPLTGFTVQTAVAGEVNLVNSGSQTLRFWDVAPQNNSQIDGGSGTWENGGSATLWALPDGTVNDNWSDGAFAVFAGTPGTVTVSATSGTINASGLQFMTSGYDVTGGAITLLESVAGSGATDVRVGDGTDAGAAMVATIDSVLSGSTTLTKGDEGTLVLTGDNTYTGGTHIEGGVLRVSGDANLGASSGGLAFSTGILENTASFTTARTVTLNSGGGTFLTDAGTTLTSSGVIGGGGMLTKDGPGTLLLTADETYTGGTTITAGTLAVGNGNTSGSIVGNVADGGTLAFNRSDTLTYGGVVSGSGTLVQNGSGTLVLTGDSTLTGTTTVNAGTLQLGAGGTSGSVASGAIVNNAALSFNRSDTFTVGSVISGSGVVTQAGAGVTRLTAANSYTGATGINGGWLYIDGDQSAATGTVTAASGTRLGGSGTIGGSVVMQDGSTLGPGSMPQTPGTITINGNLSLANNSILFYNLVQANVDGGALNDLAVVHGNLTLGGTINIVDEGQTFGPGVYRVIDYSGSLTNNGLNIGSLISAPATPQDPLATGTPLTGFVVQTAIPGQVNLVYTTGLNLNYWDGGDAVTALKNNNIIDGGNGTWWAAGTGSTSNWTNVNGVTNAPWDNSGAEAIFSGIGAGPNPGLRVFGTSTCYGTQGAVGCTVTVNNSQGAVQAAGMQFATSGYTVKGDPITLVGDPSAPGITFIRVGDGSTQSAGISAEIDSVLAGGTTLAKTDLGTLILTGANTYTGGTVVEAGTLQIANDANLGATGTGLTLDGGALATTASITTARPVTLGTGGGTLLPAAGTTLELDGVLADGAGAGALTLNGGGTLVLTNTNTYTGGTTIAAGTLQVGNGGTTGSISGDIANGGTLVFNRSDTMTYGGAVSDYAYTDINGNGVTVPGALVQKGPGTLILTGNSSYSGGTTIAAGTLQLGNGGASGGISGDVVNNGTLAFDRSDTLTFAGNISGSGALLQAGTGTTILTGTNTFAGGTTIAAGTLQVGNGGTSGTLPSLNIIDNGIFVVDLAVDFSWAGTVSGTGSAVKAGNNTLIVTGNGTYTGGTLIQSGVLQFGDGGTSGGIIGDITDNATLAVDRSDDFTYGGVISGTGNAIKLSSDTVTLTGDNTYTGGTTISAGTLQLGSGGTSGSVVGDITDNGALVFNRADSLLMNGLISGTGSLTQAGAGTVVLAADETYTGGTTISTGTLQLGNGLNTGSVIGDITDNGVLVFNRSDVFTQTALVSGSGELVQAGSGTLVLTASNTYQAGTKIEGGTLQIASDANLGAAGGGLWLGGGTLATMADITTTRATTLEQLGGTFATADGTTLFLNGLVEGAGGLTKTGGGALKLAGDNLYLGPTDVLAGKLYVNGDQSGSTGPTSVAGGAALGGTGILGGDVTISDGATLAPGNSPGTLTVNGNLQLAGGAILDYEYGQANTPGGALNDLTNVGGSLQLAGTLNITQSAGGSFSSGVYRVFNYGGSLTNNGLTLGTVPAGAYFVQTSIPGQVNLINLTGLTLNYWDGDAGPKNNGVVNGGDGTWQAGAAGGNDNWTTVDGSVNAPYTDSAFAVFEGTAGTVTLDASLGAVNVSGMQFATGGYVVQGGPITLTGASDLIWLGDGTSTTPGTTTIDSVLTGNASLVVNDIGTLVLNGNNSWTGGLTIDGATVQAAMAANLAGATAPLTLDGGTLHTTGSFAITGATTLTYSGGTFETDAGTQLTVAGAIGGDGGLTKSGAGLLLLSGANRYAGPTTIDAGTLQIASDANLGAASGGLVLDGGTLATTADITSQRAAQLGTAGGAFDTAAGTTLTLNGVISGVGGLTKTDSGTLKLAGANTYTGATQVLAGSLYVNGDQSAATGALTLASGTLLAGTGTIGGNVAIASGATLAPGNDNPGTLTISGNLQLAAGSVLQYEFGQAGTAGGGLNDLTNVGGDLQLAGTLNVAQSAGGSFAPGLYRVFNYGGSLTNDGLTLGSAPSGTYFIQTSIPGEVNLINASGTTLNWWDGDAGPKNNGVVNGGDGTWQAAGTGSNDNWTLADGSINAPFSDGSFAVFAGSKGTVTVDTSLGAVNVSGMQFATDGYDIKGGTINLTPGSDYIMVGDGTSASAGMTATIDSVLTGDAALILGDAGTLVLTAANSWTGGTVIDGGVLQVASAANLAGATAALSLDGGTLHTTGSFSISGPVTLLEAGGTFETDGGTQLTLANAIAGSGGLVKSGTGDLILDAANTFTGATAVNVGTLVLGDAAHAGAALAGSAQVASGASLGGYGSVAGSVTIAAGGVLGVADALPQLRGQGPGAFTVGGSLINAGTVQLGGAGVGNLLSAAGYQGQGNSLLTVNARLNGDSNSATDRLLINGGTSTGRSVLDVSNVGGLGGITTGNGILVVDAERGATTVVSNFALGNRVEAGPYEYYLFRGGLNGTDPQSWYLRSSVPNPPDPGDPQPQPPAPPLPPEVPQPPVDPAQPPGTPIPVYRPEVSLYTAAPSMMLQYGQAVIGSLHERVGEEEQLRGAGLGLNAGPSGAWARLIGQDGRWDSAPGGIYSGKGPSFDNDVVAGQAGLDLYKLEMDDGYRDIAGVETTIGHSHGLVHNYDGNAAGSNAMDAWGVGGYWTHFGANDWYLDAHFQATWYHLDASDSVTGSATQLKTDAFGITSSMEGGYPLKFGHGWQLEPQAQLIYQSLRIDDTRDAASVVSFDNSQGLTGRLGGRLAKDWQLDQNQGPGQGQEPPRRLSAWLLANAWREFRANPQTEFSSEDGPVPFRSDLTGTWGEFGVGVSAQLSHATTLYGQLDYQKSFGGGPGLRTYGGTLGIRVNW